MGAREVGLREVGWALVKWGGPLLSASPDLMMQGNCMRNYQLASSAYRPAKGSSIGQYTLAGMQSVPHCLFNSQAGSVQQSL